jgi:hypothetical protein
MLEHPIRHAPAAENLHDVSAHASRRIRRIGVGAIDLNSPGYGGHRMDNGELPGLSLGTSLLVSQFAEYSDVTT